MEKESLCNKKTILRENSHLAQKRFVQNSDKFSTTTTSRDFSLQKFQTPQHCTYQYQPVQVVIVIESEKEYNPNLTGNEKIFAAQ
jgi:hypothetical protein